MLTLLPILLVVGAGLIAGVFFAFSTFVMQALDELPAESGIAAMQRINVVVLNPLFLGVFVGTALLAVVAIVSTVFAWGTVRATLLFISSLSYLIGCFGVTGAFNVPRNERLAGMPPASDDASAYWPIYLREWVFWNHIRTLASIVATACAAAALAF